MALRGKICLVTGASRGIGRGIALQLGSAGAKVYVTGRKPEQSLSSEQPDLPSLEKTANEITQRGGHGLAVYVDHSDMKQVELLFKQIAAENDGQLDILINNAYAAVQALSESTSKNFWELPAEIWDTVNNVGMRNHYYCSVFAARLMVPRRQGLILFVSSAGGLSYLFNVAYGVGKAASDRMAADMAMELKSHSIAVVSLWPGAVRTELITKLIGQDEGGFKGKPGMPMPSIDKMKQIFEEGETIEFSGRAVVALASDPQMMHKTGRILITSDLAKEYNFVDIDGRSPASMRSLSYMLTYAGWNRMANLVPGWIKLPGWILTAATGKL